MSQFPISLNDRWDLPRDAAARLGLRTDIEQLLARAWRLDDEAATSLATDAVLGRRDTADENISAAFSEAA